MNRHEPSHRASVRRTSMALVTAIVLLIPPAAAVAGTGGGAAVTAGGSAPGSERGHEAVSLADANDRLASLQAEIATQQESIGTLQERISDVSDQLGEQQAAYDATQAELTSARERLGAAQVEFEALRARLDERAVQALRMNSGPQMEFLLESDSFAEVSDRLQFLNQIQLADARLAAEVQAQSRGLQAQQDDLEATLHEQADLVAELDARQEELLSVFAEQQRQIREMSRARKEATALVRELERERAERSPSRVSAGQIASIGGKVAPYGVWGKLFLAEIGAPACHDNMVVMVTWQAAEGTQAAWNPLATTLRLPGSTSFNSVGVQNYSSLQQGLQALRQTLENGASTYGYGAVLESLRACAGAMATAQAINASSWCRGCASGSYVTGLIPVVQTYFERYASDSAG